MLNKTLPVLYVQLEYNFSGQDNSNHVAECCSFISIVIVTFINIYHGYSVKSTYKRKITLLRCCFFEIACR